MFLYPSMLLGLLAVGIPIVIHLLNKRRYEHVNWAAMRFLQTASEQNQRRLRFEDLLLLVMRCALLALLALALARPVFHAMGGMLGRGNVTAVIAIDNSYSMTGTDGVTSRFQNSKTAADQIVNALPTGSSVSVLLASNVVDAVIPEPTFDLTLARKSIGDATLTDRSTNLLPAFRRAFETLKKSPGAKELYLITDGQRSGWAQLPDIIQSLQDTRDDVTTKVVLVGPEVRENAGVSDLRVAGDLTPVDRPLRFEATVTNFGSTDIHNLTVQLRIDADVGKKTPAENETIIDTIAAGQSQVVSLFGKLRTAGPHAVTVSIPSDHLPADDQRTIVVRGTARAKVLIVRGDSSAASEHPSEKTAAAFLRGALLPIPPSQVANYFLQVNTVPIAELATARLEDYAAVITADVPEFDRRSADNLADFVQHGGGLIVFPGPNTSAENYNSELVDRLHLLPAALAPARGDATQQEKFFTLQAENFDHPIATVWKDSVNGSPAAAHFYRAFTLEPQVDKGSASQVVLRYSDGAPAVMQRGSVILFSSSADTSWNDLPDHGGIFVPLMYRSLASLLSRGDGALNIGVGVPFQQNVPIDYLGRPVTIIDPSGNKSATTVSLQSESALVRSANTSLAGSYDAVSMGTPPLEIKYAAQADANESRLESLAESERQSLAATATVVSWTPTTTVGSAATTRSGDDWWIPLAMLALAIAATEPFVANRFSEAK